MSCRVSFSVQGVVQGVSYRYWTKTTALGYGLVGWVHNTPDGRVVGEVQGPQESVSKLLAELETGPKHAKVTKVDHELVELKDDDNDTFVVRI